ncbi:MAG TPA: redox-sensing transcriptional repressor Rex [Patescibacteria group bacterium]|nr:redox-sensing transcriptional repressor Rex [Patescibacteria group bacterium]
MERFSNISMAVVRRLPKYYRYLGELLNNDIKRVSSQELSKITGFTASQIRQDLNCFGGFGQQGYGYNAEELHKEIGKILGLDRQYRTVIVGAGNLGHAIANYSSFDKSGFKTWGVFDVNEKVIGEKVSNVVVMHSDKLEGFVKENDIAIGIICTPKAYAQDAADLLVKGGVKGIWNFAPADLKVPDDIIVENVNLSESLFTVSYLLKEREETNIKKK